MKPYQLFKHWLPDCPAGADEQPPAAPWWPTLTTVAVAIASSVVLMLAGCASSAGIVSTAQPVARAQATVASAQAAGFPQLGGASAVTRELFSAN